MIVVFSFPVMGGMSLVFRVSVYLFRNFFISRVVFLFSCVPVRVSSLGAEAGVNPIAAIAFMTGCDGFVSAMRPVRCAAIITCSAATSTRRTPAKSSVPDFPSDIISTNAVLNSVTVAMVRSPAGAYSCGEDIADSLFNIDILLLTLPHLFLWSTYTGNSMPTFSRQAIPCDLIFLIFAGSYSHPVLGSYIVAPRSPDVIRRERRRLVRRVIVRALLPIRKVPCPCWNPPPFSKRSFWKPFGFP